MHGARATGGVRAKRGGPARTAVAAGAQPGTEHRALHDGTGAARLWEPEASAEGAKIAVFWPTDTPDLDALYSRRGEQAYFEETTLRGYPAADTFGEDRPPAPCDAARKAAESVVDNLRQNPAA